MPEVTRAQQALWARGDFYRIGVSQVDAGEMLVRALHVHAAGFSREWVELADRHNVATGGTCEIPATYLQVVATTWS